MTQSALAPFWQQVCITPFGAVMHCEQWRMQPLVFWKEVTKHVCEKVTLI